MIKTKICCEVELLFLSHTHTIIIKYTHIYNEENITTFHKIGQNITKNSTKNSLEKQKAATSKKKKKSRNGPEGSNTVFSATSNFKEHNITQILIGTESRAGSLHTICPKSNGPNTKLDHFIEVGVPTSLIHDNSNMRTSTQWKEYMRKYWVKDQFIELYHPNQNPIE